MHHEQQLWFEKDVFGWLPMVVGQLGVNWQETKWRKSLFSLMIND